MEKLFQQINISLKGKQINILLLKYMIRFFENIFHSDPISKEHEEY